VPRHDERQCSLTLVIAASLTYHLGNGWFGGFTPLIATAIVTRTGNSFAGLWYPIAVATMTLIVGSIFLKETRGTRIWDEVGGAP